jgi:FAS-associated factor 2
VAVQEKEAALGPEPPADCTEPVTTCLIRLPDGSRISRRFLVSSPLEDLFTFVDAKGAGGQPPSTYQLVGQYPRRIISPGCAVTLADAGLRGQEALLLEPVASEA